MKILLTICAILLFTPLSPLSDTSKSTEDAEIAEKIYAKKDESEDKMNLDFRKENSEKKEIDGIVVNEKDNRVYVTVTIKFPTTEGDFNITGAKMKDNVIELEIEQLKGKGDVFLQVITYRSKTISFSRKSFPETLPKFTVPGKTFSTTDR